MEINSFVDGLKEKFSYSDELAEFLKSAIPAIISYYGEEYKNVVFATLENCEIHIQQENENDKQYLNQYFGDDSDVSIPFLGGAFQSTRLSIKNNQVVPKSIVYMKSYFSGQYVPFDFNDDEKVSMLIHEICHAIKEYGKLKIENGMVTNSSGLMKAYYQYDKDTNSLKFVKKENVGLEEAINSFDEASIMTIMTGIYHQHGAYKGMTTAIRELFQHEELHQIIKKSQFNGSDDWKEFIGFEESNDLIVNFDNWVNGMYSSPSDNLDEMLQMIDNAMDNIAKFIENFSTKGETTAFLESRKEADKKLVELVNNIIQLNPQTNEFEEVEQVRKVG